MKEWRDMGHFRNRSRFVGPVGVVLALTVGATLPIVLGIAGLAAASHATVAACSPPNSTPTTAPTKTPTPVANSSPPCLPALTVVPSAQLADGQIVTVTGSNFSPNQGIGMVECQAGALGPAGCDLSTVQYGQTDGTGSFSSSYSVSRDISVNNADIDCALSPCFLGAADLSDYSVAAAAAIEFNPNIPPLLTGTINPTGMVNATKGIAYITGTITCSTPTQVQVDVELAQVFHRRFNNTSSGFAVINCNPRKKGYKWKVAIPPGFGLFGPGNATADVYLSASVANFYRNIEITGGVKLVPKP
jgi:hypothetical protein